MRVREQSYNNERKKLFLFFFLGRALREHTRVTIIKISAHGFLTEHVLYHLLLTDTQKYDFKKVFKQPGNREKCLRL